MEPTPLQSLGEFMKEMAEYSKWLVATSAVVIGFAAHAVKQARSGFDKAFFSLSLLAFTASIGCAVYAVLNLITLSAQLRDPSLARRPVAEVSLMINGPIPFLQGQIILFGCGVLLLVAFLIGIALEAKEDTSRPSVDVAD